MRSGVCVSHWNHRVSEVSVLPVRTTLCYPSHHHRRFFIDLRTTLFPGRPRPLVSHYPTTRRVYTSAFWGTVVREGRSSPYFLETSPLQGPFIHFRLRSLCPVTTGTLTKCESITIPDSLSSGPTCQSPLPVYRSSFSLELP